MENSITTQKKNLHDSKLRFSQVSTVEKSRVQHLFCQDINVLLSLNHNTESSAQCFLLYTRQRNIQTQTECRDHRLCKAKTQRHLQDGCRESGLHLYCNILIELGVCMMMTVMLLEAFYSLQRTKTICWKNCILCDFGIKSFKDAQNSGYCQWQFVKPYVGNSLKSITNWHT